MRRPDVSASDTSCTSYTRTSSSFLLAPLGPQLKGSALKRSSSERRLRGPENLRDPDNAVAPADNAPARRRTLVRLP
ncbi:hypothetical protein [Deinococcus ruber]|uniref:hypothetical protein n=1 Tax=Deinococcus ruber TaxID=1848197 RepID=UPI00166B751D|nr:hypothetical protein [Deinococcus ruber]